MLTSYCMQEVFNSNEKLSFSSRHYT